MKIHLFSACFNEEIMLPYYLRHYSQFVDKITIYDNMSTDKSVEIMKANGVNVIPFESNNEYCETWLLNLKNNCWRGSDADLVIVCDIDELIYHPDLINILERSVKSGYTLIIPQGYNIVSEELPTKDGQIYDELQYGFYDKNYSKPCIFNPSKVDIRFNVGSHSANPIGDVKIYNSDIKLLHCKVIGRKFFTERNKLFGDRSSALTKRNMWGQYWNRGEKFTNDFYDSVKNNLIKVV